MIHSINYYRQLYNSIKQLEDNCKEVNYKVLPSTINYKRKSKFIKTNSNTNKTHKKVGWVLWDSQSCVSNKMCGIGEVSWQSQE